VEKSQISPEKRPNWHQSAGHLSWNCSSSLASEFGTQGHRGTGIPEPMDPLSAFPQAGEDGEEDEGQRVDGW